MTVALLLAALVATGCLLYKRPGALILAPVFLYTPYRALMEKIDLLPHIYVYHLLVVLILLFGMFIHTPPRPWQLSLMLKDKLFVALGLLWLVSAIYGLGSASESQLVYFIPFSYGFFLFFIYGLIIFDKRFVNDFCLGFLYFGCLFPFIMFVVLGITPTDLTDARGILTDRQYYTVSWDIRAGTVKDLIVMNPNSHGFYAALLALVAFVQLARAPGFFTQVVSLLVFATSIYWLALSASRGNILALAASLICYAALSGQSLSAKIKRLSIFVVAVGVCLVIVVGGNLQLVTERFQLLLDPLYFTSQARFRWYEQLVQLFPEYFFVGAGVGQWAEEIGFSYDSRHPHSIVIQLLLELGIMGAVLLILLYIGGALAFLRVIRNDRLPASAHALAMGWFLCLVFLHVDGSVWGRTLPFLPFSAALIAINARYAEQVPGREMIPARARAAP